MTNPTGVKRKLTVGVLGGMGPEATVDFMGRILALTPATIDQDHVPMVVDNNPQVPDRQRAMRSDDGAGVRDALAKMAMRLEVAGADFLAMPCNTAHAFVDDAVDAVSIPFISIIDTTIAAAKRTEAGVATVGLLATDACLSADVYQHAAEEAGLRLKMPDSDGQKQLMDLIFRVKGGATDEDVRTRMSELASALVDAGADALIAGCTEIPLVLRNDAVSVPLVSSTEALAARCVAISLGTETIDT